MAEIVSIQIIPDDLIIYLGDEIQYQALATLDDGSVEDITEFAEWSCGASPILAEFSTDTKGLLRTLAVGTDTIYVEYGSPIYETTLIIHNPLIVPQDEDEAGQYRPLSENYLSLITSQYQNSPKYLHWIKTYLEMVEDVRELATSLMCYFSLNRIVDPASLVYQENAWTVRKEDIWTVKKGGGFVFFEFESSTGDQLDTLGVILGQPRKVYFKEQPFDSPPTPASDLVLDDDTYRMLLKNKIMINTWDGKAATLEANWRNVFVGGTISVQDNQDMTVDVLITGTLDATLVNLIRNDYIVPRPQGVLLTYMYGSMPFFGFDRVDDYIAGFDIGIWV